MPSHTPGLHALKHGRPTRQHDVVVQLPPHVYVTLVDGVMHQVVDAL